MLTARQFVRPIWQGVLLTVAIGLLGVESARAVSEQPGEYSPAELEQLIGPIALYPDDLIAIILPASSYPLQIVEAARYLEKLEDNPDLEPTSLPLSMRPWPWRPLKTRYWSSISTPTGAGHARSWSSKYLPTIPSLHY